MVKIAHLAKIQETPEKVQQQLDYCVKMARISHMSEGKGNESEFLKKWWFHENIWEFGVIHIRFRTSIAIGRELLRHRMMSPIQESTRYVKYDKYFAVCDMNERHTEAYEDAQRHYQQLIEDGEDPEVARNVLPLGLATTIGIAVNFRELRTMFRQRLLNPYAHPEIRLLMQQIWDEIPDIVKIGLEPDPLAQLEDALKRCNKEKAMEVCARLLSTDTKGN